MTQSHTTIADWLRGKSLPSVGSETQFEHLLRVVGITDDTEIKEWVAALARARREPADQRAPFRGLSSYRPEDADWYFGRDALTSLLVARLVALDAAGGGMELVVGASGAGKTSLLYAGLIPALRAGQLGWVPDRIVSMTPGTDPLNDLAGCLRQGGAGGDGDHNIVGEKALDGGADGRTVLVVDQLEQLFTACTDEQQQRAFIAELSRLATRGVLVVIGLRADFYDRALRHRPLLDVIDRGQFTVGAMTEAELREAIVAPAAKANADIESGLVELLLREVAPRHSDRAEFAHDPGALPLLSHALYTMWRHSTDRRLTVGGYWQVGGIDGAVAVTANQVYQELDPLQRDLARCLFLDLVHISADAADTRRRVALSELIGDGDDAIAQRHVLDRFVAQRIITVDTGTVELSHEAVLTAWPQLRQWLDRDRAGHVVGQQLADAAATWRAEPDPSLLYQGSRLAAAQEWITDRRHRVPPSTEAFVEASIQLSRRRTRRLQRTVTLLGVMLAMVAGLGAVAVYQRGQALTARQAADLQRDQAQSRAIAVQANDLRTKDPTVARQLALAAYRTSPTVEARSALLDASALRAPVRLRGGDGIGIMYVAAIDPTGQVLAAGTETGVRLWAVSGERPVHLATLPTGLDAKVYHVAFTPDGGMLAAASADATVRLWNTTNPAAPTPVEPALTGLGGKVYSLAVNSDGSLLAAATSTGHVHLWTRDHTGRLNPAGSPIPVSAEAVKSVAFHGLGTLVAAAADGQVSLWDVTQPTRPTRSGTLSGPVKEIGQITVSPNGRMIAAGSADTNAYLWTLTDPAAPPRAATVLRGASSWINSVAFSPDSTRLAVASSDAELGVRVFDVVTRKVMATLPHPAPVTAVRFSPDGATIVTSANDGYARLWPVAAPTLELPGLVSATQFSPDGRILAVGSNDTRLYDVTVPNHPTPYGPGLPNRDGFNSALAFSPDSRTLAAAHGRSGTVQLWNVANAKNPRPLGEALAGHAHQIEAIAFSPDGRVLATGSRDMSVRLWDTTDPRATTPLATLTGFTGSVFSVAFSSDGRHLAAASSDKTIRIWDLIDPRRPAAAGAPLTAANHYIYSVAFSPDGRTLASSSADRTVRLWDVSTIDRPTPIGSPLRGPNDYVYSVAFSEDGTTLAAAVTDATVWLWNVHSREHPTRTATLTLPADAVYSVDHHPNQHTLVAGGADARSWLWMTDPERAAAHTCATTGDAITEDEWATHIPDRPYQPPCQ
ncbi:hypothetical protein ACFXA2_01670 [Micromonospora chalcea]